MANGKWMMRKDLPMAADVQHPAICHSPFAICYVSRRRSIVRAEYLVAPGFDPGAAAGEVGAGDDVEGVGVNGVEHHPGDEHRVEAGADGAVGSLAHGGGRL